MATAKLTLIGMYNYDNTIFNDLILPDGIDKDLLISSLLIEKGEFEVLFPDPGFMKSSIKIWSGKWYRTFAEWLKGTQASWNPIYNYDRYEESKDANKKEYGSTVNADFKDEHLTDLQDKRSVNLKDETTTSQQDKRTADLQDKRSVDLKEGTEFNNSDTTTQMTDTTTEHQVSAYDSAAYSPSSKDIVKNGTSKIDHNGNVDNLTSGTDTMNHTGTDTTDRSGTDTSSQTGTDTMNHTGTDTLTRSGKISDTDGHELDENIHSAHLYGNIGVTTSAAMLREFYDIAKWNLYEHIADVFSSELLISVY